MPKPLLNFEQKNKSESRNRILRSVIGQVGTHSNTHILPINKTSRISWQPRIDPVRIQVTPKEKEAHLTLKMNDGIK